MECSMKTDLYTKVMLTIIATCLLWLSFGGPSRLMVLQAASPQTHVVIDGWMPMGSNGQYIGLQRTSGGGVPVTVYPTRP